MRWYEKLYVGEKAKKHRYETIQAVGMEDQWAFMSWLRRLGSGTF